MQKMEAYYNLHKRTFSVRPMGGTVRHTDLLYLTDAEFVVQPAGNAKVRAEGRKNVHAYVRGYEEQRPFENEGWRRAFYNPYKHTTFVDGNGDPVLSARHVMLQNRPDGPRAGAYVYYLA